MVILAQLYLLFCQELWGVFVRNISANVYVITFFRVFVGLIFLVVFLLLTKKNQFLKKVYFSFALVTSGVFLSLTMLTYSYAINHITLANAVFLLYLAPIIAVAIAAILFKEKFTITNIFLLCFALLGLLFLIEFNLPFGLSKFNGYMWGLSSAMCYSLFIVANRKVLKTIPILVRSLYQLLFATITILPFIDSSIFKLSINDIYWLTTMAFFQGFLVIVLFSITMQYLKVIEFSIMSYIEPLVASLIGYLLYSESLTNLQLIGCMIIIFSGILQIYNKKFD